MNSKIKAIVWDLDGTLFYSEKTASSIKKVLISICSKYTGDGLVYAKKRFEKVSANNNWIKTAFLITKKNELDIVLEMEKKIKRHLFAKRSPELLSLFSKLKKYRHFVLTNSTQENTFKVLDRLGFVEKPGKLRFFEKVFSSDSEKTLKPNLKMFRGVLQFSNLKPKEILMVGDFDNMDIIPAKKLGMDTHGVGSAISGNTRSATVLELPKYLKFRFIRKLLYKIK